MAVVGGLESDGSAQVSASAVPIARAAPVRVGVPIRNPNYLKLAVSWFFIGAAALAVNLQSSFHLEELGWFILGAPVLLGAIEAVKWQRVFLSVESSGVTTRRVVRRRAFTWAEIDRFEISAPGDRTPLMLSFAWWADRCSLRLVTGARHSVLAVQPYHGFTILTFLNLRRWTSADAVVDELNRMARGATNAP